MVTLLVKIVGRTLRVKEEGRPKKFKGIYIFWHSDFFPLVYLNKNNNITVLVSRHRDGEYLSQILIPLGYKVVRGSSDDGGAMAVRELVKFNTTAIAIAPDGPRGPKKKLKKGVISIAKILKLPIIPVGVHLDKKIILKSWDRFKLPIPFTRCKIYWGKPIVVTEVSEENRKKVEEKLNQINETVREL